MSNVIGNARVSTDSQMLDSQLKAAGATRIFADALSGMSTARPRAAGRKSATPNWGPDEISRASESFR